MEEYARNGVPEECSRQLTYICMQRKTPSYRGADYHRIISTAETHADPLVCPGGLTHRIRDPSQDPDVHWTLRWIYAFDVVRDLASLPDADHAVRIAVIGP